MAAVFAQESSGGPAQELLFHSARHGNLHQLQDALLKGM
jgi:hypothetical protein